MYPNTRASTAFASQAPPHVLVTPKQEGTDALGQYFEQLRNQFGIALPYRERSSPSKRRKSPGHDAAKLIALLFHKDIDALKLAMQEFSLRSPTLHTLDEKLNHLLDSLTIAVNSAQKNGTLHSPYRQSYVAPSPNPNGHANFTSMGPPPSISKLKRTPPSISSHWPPTPLQPVPIDDQPAPSSPTLSIKSLLHKSTPNALDDVIKYPALPAPVTSQRLDLYKAPAGITTVNTSFAPTSANTSFATSAVNTSFATTTANTSFWSEQQGSQEPVSPATSVASTVCMDGTDDARDGFSPSQIPISSMNDPEYLNAYNKASHGDHSLSQIPLSSMNDPAYLTAYDKAHFGIEEYALNTSSTESKGSLQDAQDVPATTTPATSEAQGTRELPPPKTPSRENSNEQIREHARVKRIAADGISGGLSLQSFSELPYYLRFECARVLQGCNLSARKLDALWDSKRDFDSLHKLAEQQEGTAYRCKKESAYQESSLCLKLRWTDSKAKDGPLFVPQILAPTQENLNGWQRKFGSDRFLFVEVDPLAKPPDHLGLQKQQKENIHRRFLKMLGKPQEFLGRTWLQFYAQAKKSKKSGDIDATRTGAFSFIFVALTGDNGTLPPLTAREVLGWSLPFAENLSKPWRRIYARLDLQASRTTLALALTPDEIEDIDDDYATNDPPDTRYNNEGYAEDFKNNEVYKEDTVMNDGCSEVPEWTMRKIAEAMKLEYIPSAAQFRFRGAKGMFSSRRERDGDFDENPDVPPNGPKLRITKSQNKLEPPKRDHTAFDPCYYSLQINAVSHPVRSSFLYLDFLPILTACGVPANNIEALALRQVQAYQDGLTLGLTSRAAFRRWLNEQGSILEQQQRDSDIPEIAGFPQSLRERAIRMLESGFTPTVFKPLAKVAQMIIESWTARMTRTFKLLLPRSTMLYGIADRTDTLQPGEFHLCFSTPQNDENGRLWMSVEGPALCARNPAANPWDIQKLTGVRRPELGHILDVIVFSRKGPRPPAEKLSGGDYDGDMFWVAWEPLLTKHFKNLPAPQNPQGPESLCIKVDQTPLSGILNDPFSEEQVCKFIQLGTANRMQPSLLGIMTRTHARAAYKYGILSDEAMLAARMKDLLMDSDKNGYSFDEQDFEEFKKKNNMLNLPNPAYFEYTAAKDEDRGTGKYERRNDEHIVDRIFFGTLKPKFEGIRDSAIQQLTLTASLSSDDADLTAFYDQMVADASHNTLVRDELTDLEKELKKLCDLWNKHMKLYHAAKDAKKLQKASEEWDTALVICREFYLLIEPVNDETKPIIREWKRFRGEALTHWACLKASALAKLYSERSMWFCIAGKELCRLKADAQNGTIPLMKEAYVNLTLKKSKGKRKLGALDDDANANVDEGLMDFDG